jgi:hypothetical protein
LRNIRKSRPGDSGANALHRRGRDSRSSKRSPAPIEQQMSGVDNMNYMYSINANSGDIRLIVNFDVATTRTSISPDAAPRGASAITIARPT